MNHFSFYAWLFASSCGISELHLEDRDSNAWPYKRGFDFVCHATAPSIPLLSTILCIVSYYELGCYERKQKVPILQAFSSCEELERILRQILLSMIIPVTENLTIRSKRCLDPMIHIATFLCNFS